MRLALIPARAGSKRLKNKNILEFAGRPMLVWSVAAAQESGLFDQVVVSTESDEIAEIAIHGGATVLRRALDLASDEATLAQVLGHAFSHFTGATEMCMLLANCPLRPASEIVRSEKAWRSSQAAAMLSVVDYGWTPPFRAQKLNEKHELSAIMPEWTSKKSQEYPSVVCPSGAIYWCRPEQARNSDSLYLPGLSGFMMPWHLAVDIDTPADLALARCIRFSMDNGFTFGSE